MYKSFFISYGNFYLKKYTRAAKLSYAVLVSLYVLLDPKLNPTPPGDSIYSKFASLFQECGFTFSSVDFGSNMKGPFSYTIPMRLEHPGPPLSHRMVGSWEGSFCESKKT